MKLNSFLSGDFLREIVFGANDGVVTSIGFLVGISGAVASQATIVIAGTMTIVAGSVSMALGNYLGVKSQNEFDTSKAEDKWIGPSPVVSGIIMGLFYLISGLPPLLPFIFLRPATRALIVSVLVAILIMGTIGFLRWWLTGKGFWKKIMETVLIGMVAAFVGFLAGEVLRYFGFTDVSI